MSLIRQLFSAIWKWLQKPACWCSSPFRLFHCYRCNYSIILPVSKFGISFSFFFLSGFSFTGTGDSQDKRGREGTIFYFTLPLPPAHEYSDIYLQLFMWDDYHVFLITPVLFTRLLLDEIYQLIELPLCWWMMQC